MKEKINELAVDITLLIESFKDHLPPYEVGNQLIALAVSMMLETAPNHLVAIKTIMACIENGIIDYEDLHK